LSAGARGGAVTLPQPTHAGADAPVRLKVEQASYAYAATDRSAPTFTLGPASFGAQRGELLAILGPNASGKSTMLKLLAGLLKPLSGRIEVSDEDCLLAGNALAQVGADALRDRWMDQLSGGEKQRVILARALAQQPSLLLLDEPTQHLDIGGKVELLRRLRRLADENRYTVIVVTHELNLAAEFSDRIVLLHKGKCPRIGTPAEVYQRELLEEVFEAPLEVEAGYSGRPRVILRASR
jgi:iron complex transport system ATP-binding protein